MPRGRWTLVQKTAQQPWRQILVDPAGTHGRLEERRVYLDAPARPPGRLSVLQAAVAGLRTLFRTAMMPAGFPHSVHRNYLRFSLWGLVQGVAGSASGVLSTQCLLVGLGLAGAAPGGTVALAATLNWVLKDGIGNLGGILFVSRFGATFDQHAKRYRLGAAAAMGLATLLELLVPLVPGLFLPLASLANTCKSVSWMANSATRAQIQRHFTRLDNLGDLTGKAASLNTAANVLGTGLGVVLSGTLLAADLLPPALVARCFAIALPLVAVYVYASYRSCRLAVSPRLTLQRLDLVLRSLVPALCSPGGRLDAANAAQLARYVSDPTMVGWNERFVHWPWQRDGLAAVALESSARLLAETVRSQHDADAYEAFFRQHRFAATHSASGRLCVWFADDATQPQLLTGLLHVYLARHLYTGTVTWAAALDRAAALTAALQEDYLRALQSRGWELSLDADRSPIILGHLGPLS